MSGTSLDGLDIAFCKFKKDGKKWSYKIKYAETVSYPQKLAKALANATELSGLNLALLHTELGTYIGKKTSSFIKKHGVSADFISSHGHTVFHQPSRKFTLQIGNGAAIAVEAGLPVVCDFRTTDVALGGQGAPLVPIGDELLFGEYDYCLNLGGIANISYKMDNSRIAFDICAANMVLNFLANKKGLFYDENGKMASRGSVNKALLSALNKNEYFKQPAPKSLGKEWVVANQINLLEKSKLSVPDLMATVCEHIGFQIGKNIRPNAKVLVTGGGAFNGFLLKKITHYLPSGAQLIVPDTNTINFKEAIIFGFLGVLRWAEKPNALQSVTGASRNSVGGCIYTV